MSGLNFKSTFDAGNAERARAHQAAVRIVAAAEPVVGALLNKALVKPVQGSEPVTLRIDAEVYRSGQGREARRQLCEAGEIKIHGQGESLHGKVQGDHVLPVVQASGDSFDLANWDPVLGVAFDRGHGRKHSNSNRVGCRIVHEEPGRTLFGIGLPNCDLATVNLHTGCAVCELKDHVSTSPRKRAS